MILAGFGLGSYTASVWLARYKWFFLAAAFIFLGLAFYFTYRERAKTGPWSKRILYIMTAFIVLSIAYSLLTS